MTIKLIKSFSVAFALVCSTSAFAEDSPYKSAMFAFTGEQLVSELGTSVGENIENGGAVLYCQSEISIKGVAERTYCYDKQKSVSLVTDVEKTIAGLPFSPASVDGEAVPVKMSFRVGLHVLDNTVEATLIPNLGSMQERYGRDYIAPQERLDVTSWYNRYSENSWVNGEVFLGDGPLSRVAATVGRDGKTELVRELDNERAYRRDAKIVKNALRKSRFIPGFANGEPVPMGYLAVVNYGEGSGEAVSSR